MAVRIIAGNTAVQPDNLYSPEVFFEIDFDFLPGKFRVPVRVEEAGPGGQYRPPAVGINRTPFENNSGRKTGRSSHRFISVGTCPSVI